MLVIAIGNPLRQDDGVALAVAQALHARRGLDVRTVHQLLPELAESLSNASSVVFVDARRGGPHGCVLRERVVAAEEAWGGTHALDPARLVGLCRFLYGRAPEASVVSITGGRFGFGDELSEPVRRAVPAAVRFVLRARPRMGRRRR
jgi:hydrogenase maturation protease